MKRLWPWPTLALWRLATAQSTATTPTSTAQSAADDGTTGSRTSAPSLLFSVPLIVLGLYLLLLARRFPRLTLPFALGNAFALAGWAACVNLVSERGIGGAQAEGGWAEDMAVWGITAGSWVVGTVVGLLPKYGLLAGWTFLGCEGGLAVGFMLEMLADDLTIHSGGARWTIIGILTVAGLVSVVMTRNGGAIVACALSGGFLVMLGVDLLVNEDRGMAKGMPKLLDRNGHHKQALAEWDTPTMTTVFAALSWFTALLGSATQLLLFRHRGPFLPASPASALPFRGDLHAAGPSSTEAKPVDDHDRPPNGWPYDRQDSTTPGTRDSAEMVQLGRPTTHDRGTESGLSAIAEQTERSRTDSAHHADAPSPVNSLYNRVYPLSYDPNNSVRPSYDLSSLPSSSQAGEYRAATARLPPARSSWNAFADPEMPSTPPLTVFSETTLGPDDSASQVGWRRAQADAQANYFAIGRQMEEQRLAESSVDGQDQRAESDVAVPLHIANKTPQSSPAFIPAAIAPSPRPSPSTTTPTPRPAPSPTRPQKRTRFLGIPLIRILSGRSRHRPTPSASSTGAAVDLEQAPPIPEEPQPQPATSPTGSLSRPLPPIPHPPSPSTSATGLRPPPPIYGSPPDPAFAPSSAASAPSKGVFSRLDHAFGQHPSSHSRDPTGSSGDHQMRGREDGMFEDEGRSSTELTGPTGPMQGFLRPGGGSQGPVGVRRDHEGWRGAF